MSRLTSILLLLLPTWGRIRLLRMLGHEIASSARVGCSWIDIRRMTLGENARIGFGNVFKGLDSVVLKDNAKIGRFNQFTASRHYKALAGTDHGTLVLESGAVITMRHYLDCQHRIAIGERSLIAGIGTTFFTHQKGIASLHEAKPIEIGPRVYVGARCMLLPGTHIAGFAYIAAGSNISGRLSESYAVYGSGKAAVVKKLALDAVYFTSDSPTDDF